MSRGARSPTLRSCLLGAVLLAAVSCSGGDDPDENRVVRIDGPATVDDGAGANQEGAPGDITDLDERAG